MVSVPFGTQISVAAAQAVAPSTTPTVVGVIGTVGAGATASAGTLALAHTKAEMIAAVGSDGELNAWAEEFYSRELGEVLISPVASHDTADDSARNTAASNALDLFEAGTGANGLIAKLIDIHNYGTNVESGSETAASQIVTKAETVAENIRSMVYANFPAASDDALSAWGTNYATWLGNNRKARVLATGGTLVTAANASGSAASTLLIAKRADIDGADGIGEPLMNKPVIGITRAYPNIPYSLNRNASLLGRTLQNTNGGSFIANFRGWKAVVGELASASAADNKRYESILRAVDTAEDAFEDAMGRHIGTQNDAVDQSLLLQDLANTTNSLKASGVISDSEWVILPAALDPVTRKYVVALRGTITTHGIVVQINAAVEVN